MRIVVIVILIVLLVWAIVDPIIRLKEKPSIFWVSFLSIFLVVLSVTEIRWLVAEQDLKAITVKVVAENDMQTDRKGSVGVHCERFSEAFFDAHSRKGEAQIGGNESFLSYDTCANFMAFKETPYGSHTDLQIASIAITIHEAIHLTGESNEATTECEARKLLPSVLKDLQVPKKWIQNYTERYISFSEGYLGPNYQNGTC